jgi:hypothetical protein
MVTREHYPRTTIITVDYHRAFGHILDRRAALSACDGFHFWLTGLKFQ